MSRGLVSTRPFAKKRSHHSLKRAISKTGIPLPNISLSISQKAKEILSRSVIGMILLVCGFLFLIKGVFFRPEFKIEQVKFSQATEETFYDIELFNAVSNALKGKNFYMLQYFQKDAILERIQAQFPFIADMHFQMEAKADFTNKEELVATGINEIATGDREATARDGTGGDVATISQNEMNEIGMEEIGMNETGTNETTGNISLTPPNTQKTTITPPPASIKGGILGVDLRFKEPVLKVKLGEKEFGIRDEEHFLEIKEGFLLGAETFVVDTPQYLTGTTSLSGLFYEIPLETFLKIVPLIHEEIPNIVRFVYLAGSPRLALFTDNGQTLYLTVTTATALQEQFEKYHTLQERYQNFEKLQTIDLGSLDESKVIVR